MPADSAARTSPLAKMRECGPTMRSNMVIARTYPISRETSLFNLRQPHWRP
jgi:hypothetical protein